VIGYNGNDRIIYGQTYIGKDFNQLNLEINNGAIYDQLSNGEPYSEDLILSIPSDNRNTTLSLNKQLKDDYVNKLHKN
jgi:hypothetical protein